MRSSFTFNFRNLPGPLLAGIFLFVVTQVLLAESEEFWRFCYRNSSVISDDALRFYTLLKTAPSAGNDKKVFLVGSSQVREDFDVDYLNAALVGEAVFYNLGTSGNGSPLEMFMVKDQLLVRRPKVIIYVPFVGSFFSAYDPRKLKSYFDPAVLPYLIKYLGIKGVIGNRSLRVGLTDSFLGMASVFYRYRDSLRRIILREVETVLYKKKRSPFSRYAYKKGRPAVYFEQEVKSARKGKYTTNPYTEMSKELFVVFAREVMSQGVKLLVMSGPVHPLIKKCYHKGLDEDYNCFLEGEAKRLGFCYLSEDQVPKFSEEEFIDFTHLNAKGRERVSRFLEQYLISAGLT